MRTVDLDQTHYDTLGINRKASADDIKAAYRRLTKANHPDLGGDAAKFAAINVAYGALRDERAAYDVDLAAAERAATEPDLVVPEGWEPEEWLEDEVDDSWAEQEVAPAPVPKFRPPVDLNPIPVRKPPPFVDVNRRPVRKPPLSTYQAVKVPYFKRSKTKRAIAALVLMFCSFAVSIYGTPPAGVPWVAFVSFIVCVFALMRAGGLEAFGLIIELGICALLVWGAYADDEVIGAVAALGVLVPIVLAGELVAVSYRAVDTANY